MSTKSRGNVSTRVLLPNETSFTAAETITARYSALNKRVEFVYLKRADNWNALRQTRQLFAMFTLCLL